MHEQSDRAITCQQDVDKLKELLNGLKVDVIDCRHQETPKDETIRLLSKEVNVAYIISRKEENIIRLFAKRQRYLDEAKRKLSISSRQGRAFCAGKADTDNKPSSRRNKTFSNQHEYDNPDDSDGKPHNRNTVSPDDIKKSFHTKNGLTVKIYKGPITKLDVDAVVNAANEHLANSAGVAGALSKAGGYDFDQECAAVIRRDGYIPITKNVVTVAGRMDYAGVIHAVGPKWCNYKDKVECLEKVRDTVVEILKTSVKAGFRNVAMPSIGADLFGVPTDLCAAMYIQGIVDFSENTSHLNQLKEFHIIDIKDDILDMVIRYYENWRRNPLALDPYTLISQHPKADKSHGGGQVRNHHGRGKPRIPRVIEENTFIFGDKLKVFIYQADILQLDVDAIVATDGKEHKGAISKAIEQANGQTFWEYITSWIQMPKMEGQVYFVKPNLLKHLRGIYYIIMERFSPHYPPSERQLSCLKSVVLSVLDQANNLSREIMKQKEKKKKRPLKKIAMSIPGTDDLESSFYVKTCSEVMFRALDEFTRRPEQIHLTEVHLVDLRQDPIVNILQETFHRQVKELTEITKRPLPPTPRPAEMLGKDVVDMRGAQVRVEHIS